MAETKWVHLTEILRNTDNGYINPTNRPFHVCMYFMQRFRSLKKDRTFSDVHSISGYSKVIRDNANDAALANAQARRKQKRKTDKSIDPS